jgi:hypothetical protein
VSDAAVLLLLELLGADLSSTVSDRADDDMDLFAAINPVAYCTA